MGDHDCELIQYSEDLIITHAVNKTGIYTYCIYKVEIAYKDINVITYTL
jgi:hypothetical protein